MAVKKYNIDIAVAFTVILMVLMFIIPLPTVLLDFFMALNLIFSLIILLIVLFVDKPTEFVYCARNGFFRISFVIAAQYHLRTGVECVLNPPYSFQRGSV